MKKYKTLKDAQLTVKRKVTEQQKFLKYQLYNNAGHENKIHKSLGFVTQENVAKLGPVFQNVTL